ncbi:MAG: ribulose-phosphate 3-epimerase [bacterium]|nr:ribulose-phosphate 3-epimerase [bacterium]
MVKLSPSILACDFLNIEKEVKAMQDAQVDYIHFDIMDGHFVPNITFGTKFVKSVKKITKIPFDVHLMIHRPERYIDEFAEAGADIITFHSETTHFPIRLTEQIKKKKCLAGISINPGTSLHQIMDILNYVDLILLMSVEPGFHGQAFIENCYDKLKTLKEIITQKGVKTLIEIDGGVSRENHAKLIKNGADILVIGADFYKQTNYKNYVNEIKNG